MPSPFSDSFLALTGNRPMSWQSRLYEEHFAKGRLPEVIDIPTGLGKTAIMAIWLIARAHHRDKVPTRLIYVVDRRTVVDQATELAEKLRDNCESALGIDAPAISTLRGQLADNREWSRDPSRPAIIIGTVDLIGSGLLFSGYRSSYKRKPLEAGLLGQDSLLVLDEAHLSRPFEKSLGAIGKFQNGHGKPLRVIRMSATSGDTNDSQSPFTLLFDGKGNLAGDDAKDSVITKRFTAKKRLQLTALGEKEKLTDRLAGEAVELAQNKKLPGKRIVVFVRKPDDARTIAETIRKHGASKNEPGPYAASVEVLTGAMRGLERDELVKKPVLERFLDGGEAPGTNDAPAFLISTSAGEVGFDLNADHMVCDATTIDSFIQRLGRVNRRGLGAAKIILANVSQSADKSDFDKACAAATKLLEEHLDGKEVSPRALAAFNKMLTADQVDQASSPKPTMVELTDILLDAWSLTSITEPMPGRPDVAPWLRGLDDEQAQTTVAWRAELELFRNVPTSEKALQAIFAKHPICPHESLTVNTGQLLEFLKKISKLKGRADDLMATLAAIRLSRGQVVRCTLQQLMDDPRLLYADSTLILPATLGGLDNVGMLNAESVRRMRHGDDPTPSSLDIADDSNYRPADAARARLRILIERNKDGTWSPKPLPGLSIPEGIALEPTYEKSTGIINALKAAGLRVRLVQPINHDDEDDLIQSFVSLAPASAKKGGEDQALSEHIRAVEKVADRFAKALNLSQDDPIRIALLFAAKWHDEGKKAYIWQFFANNVDPNGDRPLGKTVRSRAPKLLRGYRHEFGSLLRIQHPDRCDTTDCVRPDDPDARDLASHLIATHHGAGRPHFGHAIYDPFTDAERDDLHAESIRRFARLQRKYGWWRLAWLENLLRCADVLASGDDESTEIDEAEGVEQ